MDLDLRTAYSNFNLDNILIPMQEKIAKSSDKKILVEYKTEAINGCPGAISPDFINLFNICTTPTLKLGVLTSNLEKTEGGVVFPCPNYAIKYNGGEWHLEKGSIFAADFDFMFFGKEIQRRVVPMKNDGSESFQKSIMICIGEEVEKYFERNNRPDISYVDALNLLGIEAPERFQKRYNEVNYEKRAGIISHLETLTAREAELRKEIKFVYDSIHRGGFQSGGAVTLVEDEDDANIVSWGIRETLERTLGEIKNELAKSIKLGMHKKDLKINKKPGVELNVPVYISAMCDKYQIKIE